MSFWTTERMRAKLEPENVVHPYVPDQVTHCSYELRMGKEAFITSTDEQTKIELEEGESLAIPSGQLAFLLTEEKVNIPLNAIGLISMRFSVKKKGLINVSGFHVDPGYKGRLKFAVYNAGSTAITVTRGERIFVIWFSDLVGIKEHPEVATVDGYGEEKEDHNTITSADQNNLHGDIASPAQLMKELDEVRNFYKNNVWALGVAVALLVAITVRLWMDRSDSSSAADAKDLSALVQKEVKAAIAGLENSTAESEDALSTLSALNAAFSIACFKKDVGKIEGFYSETPEIDHTSKGRFRNRSEVSKFWQARLSEDLVSLDLSTDHVDKTGNVMAETGTYSLSGPNMAAIESGSYLVVWKKAGEEWKRHKESWNQHGKP